MVWFESSFHNVVRWWSGREKSQPHNILQLCGDHLRSVGQEDGWSQVAGDATDDVNDGDAQPARQLLQVPQDGHLERHRHQAVKDPGEDRCGKNVLMCVQCDVAMRFVCGWEAALVGGEEGGGVICLRWRGEPHKEPTLPINKIELYLVEA